MASKNSVEIVIQAKDEASKAIEKAVRSVSREFSSLNASLTRVGADSAQISKINTELRRVNPKLLDAEINKVRDSLKRMGASDIYIEQVTKEMRNAEKETSNFKASAVSALKQVAAAAVVAGTAVAGGLGFAVKGAADFEQALADIKAVSGLTGEEMIKVKEIALQMGADTKYSAVEAAKGMEEMIKAGVNVEAIMSGGLKGALDLATAGGLELAEAAEIASTALNAFSADNLTVTDAANVLAGAANASATSVQEMRFALQMSSAVAAGAGAHFADTATALATFAQNGLKGSDAGTSLKTMLLNLIPQTDAQIGAFKELGLLTEKGGSAFFDASGKVKSMADIAGILKEKLKGMTDEQRIATLETMFGTDAMRGANILYKEGAEGVKKMHEEMSKVTAAEVAKEKMNTFWGAIEEVKGAVETLTIMLGTPLLAPLTDAAKQIDEFVSQLAEDIESKGLIPALKDLIPPGLAQELQDMNKWIGDLKTAFASGDWESAGKQLGDGLRTMLKNIGDFGKELGAAIVSTIKSVNWAEVGRSAVVFTVGFVLGFADGLFDPTIWWTIISDYWPEIIGVIISIIAAPAKLLAPLLKALRKIPLVGNFTAWLVESIHDVGRKMLTPFTNFVSDMFGYFKNGLSIGLKKVDFLPLLSKMLAEGRNTFTKFGENLYIWVGEAMETLGRGLGGGITKIKQFGADILKELDMGLALLVSSAKKWGVNIVEGLWEGIQSMGGWIKDKVTGWADDIAKSVTDFFGIKSPSRLMAEYGRYIAEGLANGIEENKGKAIDSSKLMAEAIAQAFDTIKANAELMGQIAQEKLDGFMAKMGETAFESTILAEKLKTLTEQINIQSNVVEVAKKAYQDMKRLKGENTIETKRLELAYLQERTSLHALRSEYNLTLVAIEEQKKAYSEMQQEVYKVSEAYRKNIAAIAEEYWNRISEVNQRLREDEKRVTDEYTNQVNARAEALKNFAGIFDEVINRETSGEGLLENLRNQVAAFQRWSTDIVTLANRGVDQGLIKELREMGPKAGPEIAALNTLTNEKLTEYVELWKSKSQMANTEALNELEYLKGETAVKLDQLRQEAIAEIDELNREWATKNDELAQDLTDTVKEIEQAYADLTGRATTFGSNFIQGIIDGVESKYAALVATINKIKATMAEIGALDILPSLPPADTGDLGGNGSGNNGGSGSGGGAGGGSGGGGNGGYREMQVTLPNGAFWVPAAGGYVLNGKVISRTPVYLHSGGIVGIKNFRDANKLASDEVASILRVGEVTVTPKQVGNLVGSRGGDHYHFAPGSIVLQADDINKVGDLIRMFERLPQVARAMGEAK